MNQTDFIEMAKERIIEVINIDEKDGYVLATLVTDQFGRRTRKPFKFKQDEWEKVRKRGYV